MDKYATFLEAYGYLMGLEGSHKNLGYVSPKVKTDLAGETLGGRTKLWKVTRAKLPIDIKIWEQVEILKKYSNFPDSLDGHKALEKLIADAYEADEWADLKGNEIPSQEVANELLEFAVHKNVRTAVRTLQYCMNKLNYNGDLFPDLLEDGWIGTITNKSISILNSRSGDIGVLLKMFNCEQGHFYNERFTEDPEQEANARGFYRRIQINKGR